MSQKQSQPTRAYRVLCAGALGLLAWGASAIVGCASTEFHYEGNGIDEDRASASVPAGMIGVCKRRFSEQPPVVNPILWEHAKWCTASTPDSFIRLGYGHEHGDMASARLRVEKMMDALRDGEDPNRGGNKAMITMFGAVRDEGKTDPWLQDRITRQSARTSVCDYSYLFNTMKPESEKLRNGDLQERRCAARAYDQTDRKEVCLFDTTKEETVWLTSGWACMTHTGELGNTESCHRLCKYDDYCSQQVSCATADVDLALCALGVCLPVGNSVVY